MTYIANRPRAQSKPTEEETRELRENLSERSAHELRLIILSAAYESSEVARRITKVMRDTGLIPPANWQPVQPENPHIDVAQSSFNSGQLTPIDVSDDSEMSGTENIQPEPQHQALDDHTFTKSALSQGTSPNHAQQGPPSSKRSNKRKTCEDKDDNVPSFFAPLPRPSSTFAKRRKAGVHPSEPNQPCGRKIHCVNCGTWTSDSKFENPHSCIYHPGTFQYDGRVCSWSCCGNVASKSRGCLITQHKGLNQDSWLLGSGVGDGRMSQYARLVASKG